MVLNTSSAAFDVVARTQADHERMRSFVQLRFAFDRLQSRAYDRVRSSGEAEANAAKDNLEQALAEFHPALDRARARAPDTDQGRALVATLGRAERGRAEDARKKRKKKPGAELDQAIDAVRADGGDNAAVEEMRRLSAPYFRFVRTVDGEIERSDGEVAVATGWAGRAATLDAHRRAAGSRARHHGQRP